MGTYTQILYQIVFSTKNRERTLVKPAREELFKYLWGIIENKNCHPYIINGVEDHLHISTSLHPSVALASLVKDIKLASTEFIKSERLFKTFNGWQEGYGAFTYSITEKERLIKYIKNQEEHHRIKTFREEYIDFLKRHNIDFDEKYIFY
ncbi:MAG: IS200/IS605 family transposase [Candidatus Kryptoniota bacterium]